MLPTRYSIKIKGIYKDIYKSTPQFLEKCIMVSASVPVVQTADGRRSYPPDVYYDNNIIVSVNDEQESETRGICVLL